jgi:hypothetical protein
MKYEDVHAIVNKLKEYKIIMSDAWALTDTSAAAMRGSDSPERQRGSGVDIEGEYVCVCVYPSRLPLLMKHNLLNSSMRVKNAEKLYVFDFEE